MIMCIAVFLHVIDGHGLWSSGWFLFTCLFFFFFFVRPNGRWDRRGRSPLAWRGLQPSTALLATGQSLCQVSTYRSTWIFSGLRWNDKLCLLFLCFDDLVASWNTIPDVSSPSWSSDWLQPLHPFARYQRRTVPWTMPASVLSIRACQPNAKVCSLVRWITCNFSDPLTR